MHSGRGLVTTIANGDALRRERTAAQSRKEETSKPRKEPARPSRNHDEEQNSRGSDPEETQAGCVSTLFRIFPSLSGSLPWLRILRGARRIELTAIRNFTVSRQDHQHGFRWISFV